MMMTFNDNYCDDKDGLDEPETSACSMFHATHICPVSYKGTLQQIKTSRIQDGMLLETSSLSMFFGKSNFRYPQVCAIVAMDLMNSDRCLK